MRLLAALAFCAAIHGAAIGAVLATYAAPPALTVLTGSSIAAPDRLPRATAAPAARPGQALKPRPPGGGSPSGRGSNLEPRHEP